MKTSTPRRPRVVIPHRFGDLNLHVEGQLFGGASGQQVQMPAHGPEEIFGGAKGLVFVGAKDALVHQIGMLRPCR